MKLNYIGLAIIMLFASIFTANAQEEDKNLFNHLSVGITAGTPGIGVDVAMPIGHYVQARAGFATFPKIGVSTDLDISSVGVPGYSFPESVGIEAKTGFTNGKVLVDVYPFRSSSFHVTAGAYFGSSTIVKAYNRENGILKDLADYNAMAPESEQIGYELGDYLLKPDAEGNINAKIETAAFKPYVGLGFGRAVPNKRIGFMFELGCMFWNSPELYCNQDKLTAENVGGDEGGIIKTMSKITVYPVLNFRLCGKIF